jgi:hypothetical protein
VRATLERQSIPAEGKGVGNLFRRRISPKNIPNTFAGYTGNGTALDAKYAAGFQSYSGMKLHRGDRSAAVDKVLGDSERDWRPQVNSSRSMEATTAQHRRPVSDATETLFAWWS